MYRLICVDYHRIGGILNEQTQNNTFFKIVVDVSAQIPKMRIRFGRKAK
jgi:hypothetical protein